jgi:hypothetical protein
MEGMGGGVEVVESAHQVGGAVAIAVGVPVAAAAAAAAAGDRGGWRGQGVEEHEKQAMEAVEEDDGKEHGRDKRAEGRPGWGFAGGGGGGGEEGGGSAVWFVG